MSGMFYDLHLVKVFFEAVECFLAEMVFDLAGVFDCCFLRNAQPHEHFAQYCVAFIHLGSYLGSLIGEEYVTVFIARDISVGFQLFHGNAYAWFRETEIINYIYSPDIAFLLSYDKYSLEIILC